MSMEKNVKSPRSGAEKAEKVKAVKAVKERKEKEYKAKNVKAPKIVGAKGKGAKDVNGKGPAVTKPKPTKKKTYQQSKPKTKAWPDIYKTIKIIVSIDCSSFEDARMYITYADSGFFTTFDISRDTVGKGNKMLFNSILGPATSRETLFKIETSVMKGMTHEDFMNLYTKHDVVSCHLSVKCLTDRRQNPSPTTGERLPPIPKLAVITIRSASVIGNMLYSGIGILGAGLIKKSVLANIGTADSRSKLKREANAKDMENHFFKKIE